MSESEKITLSHVDKVYITINPSDESSRANGVLTHALSKGFTECVVIGYVEDGNTKNGNIYTISSFKDDTRENTVGILGVVLGRLDNDDAPEFNSITIRHN